MKITWNELTVAFDPETAQKYLGDWNWLVGHDVRILLVSALGELFLQAADGSVSTEATVKVHASGERIISTAEGNGPINALDRALRAAVIQLYPELDALELIDYKVRILDGITGTDAVTRVLVGTSDGFGQWSTVGVHENVIAASWRALEDAVTFGLIRAAKRDAPAQ